MNDLKNIFLAWFSSTSSLIAAIESRGSVSVISAVVLPVIFFTVGKTVDILLQLYFRSRDGKRPPSGKETK